MFRIGNVCLFSVMLILSGVCSLVKDTPRRNVLFPSDARIVDVTKPPYSAVPDDEVDDTPAIQKAIDDHPNKGAIIYLPKGVYIITSTLRWSIGGPGGEWKRTTLQGQSREGTILRVPNRHPNFQNREKPTSVIWTGRAPAQRFSNEIRDLTVDVGVGNPGAVGMQFMANNQGCVRNVTIISRDRQGVVGLDLGYTDENGPLLVKNVRVIGFDIGVRTATAVDSETMERVALERQNVVGFRNDGQCVSVRKLSSVNEVPAVINTKPGLLTLIDCDFRGTGKASMVPAVINRGGLLVRNLKATGYKLSIENTEGVKRQEKGPIVEFASHPRLSLFPSGKTTLRLPIRETPDVPWDPVSSWASPTRFGAVVDDDRDDSEAVQAAIDSGATTVYLPRGRYVIGKTIRIRGNVRRIIGCRPWISVGEPLSSSPIPVFRFESGVHPVVVMERIETDFSGGPFYFMEHASKRTLVLTSIAVNFQGAASYRNTGTGDLFIEDVVGGDWVFKKQRVWARQFNVENEGTHVRNIGGSLWILGLKTERGGTLIETTQGGKTELLGGFCYTTTAGKLAPMFVIDESSASITIGESCFTGDPFLTLVREKRNGVVRELKIGEAPERTGGSLLVLYTGYPPSSR